MIGLSVSGTVNNEGKTPTWVDESVLRELLGVLYGLCAFCTRHF